MALTLLNFEKLLGPQNTLFEVREDLTNMYYLRSRTKQLMSLSYLLLSVYLVILGFKGV